MSSEVLQGEVEKLRVQVAQLRLTNDSLLSERERYRQQSEQQIQRLDAMFEFASRIACTVELDRLLPALMEDAMSLMRAEASSLMLLDEDTGELVFEVAVGSKGEQVKPFRLAEGEGIAGWVLQTGKSLLAKDARNDPRHAKQVDRLVGYQAKSILCSPLRADGRVIGVVQVLNRRDTEDGAFDEDDVPAFEAFADQAATAVAKALAYRDLADMFEATIGAFSATLDARSPVTKGQSERVTRFAVAIGEEIGLDSPELKDLRIAGLLHDIGFIAIPDAIMLKPGPLSVEEYSLVKTHPRIGYEIFKPIGPLQASLPGILHHHERFDGTGYPDGLIGDSIPLQARILAVADCFDALTSERAYRAMRPAEGALRLIVQEASGAQLDPEMTDALVALYAKGKVRAAPRKAGDQTDGGR